MDRWRRTVWFSLREKRQRIDYDYDYENDAAALHPPSHISVAVNSGFWASFAAAAIMPA